MLDPYRWYFSGNSYVTGNPFLQPSFADNFKFSHTWKAQLTSALLFYRICQSFGQVPHFNSEIDQQIYTRENFYTEYRYSLKEYFHFKPWPWWQSQEELNLSYVKQDFDPTQVIT